MPFSARQFGIASFTALYGAVVLCGYGLHAWAPCQDETCCTATGDDPTRAGQVGTHRHADHRHWAGGEVSQSPAAIGQAGHDDHCCGHCHRPSSIDRQSASERRGTPGAEVVVADDGRASVGGPTSLGWSAVGEDHPQDCAICAFLAKLKHSGPLLADGTELAAPVSLFRAVESSQRPLQSVQLPTARGPPQARV